MIRKVLLIGPKFFGYTAVIVEHLNTKDNVNAVFIDERGSNQFFNKAVYRSPILSKLFKHIIKKRRQQIYNEIKSYQPTDVIFISPEYMSDEDFHQIRETTCKVSLYMWDSFANKPAARSYNDKFDACMTFDFEDATLNGIELLNLFAEPAFMKQTSPKSMRNIDVGFVGTVHSNRIQYLHRLKKECLKRNFTTYTHGYYGNYYYYIRAKIFEIGKRWSIGTWKSLSKIETASIFQQSYVVLDITHPNQNGLTSRSFEALASGAVLLTNNKNAAQQLPYYRSRIFVYDEQSFEKCLSDAILFAHTNLQTMESEYLGLNRFCLELLK